MANTPGPPCQDFLGFPSLKITKKHEEGLMANRSGGHHGRWILEPGGGLRTSKTFQVRASSSSTV